MVIANIVALCIAIIGCLNWFLVGVFSWNFVSWAFGIGVFTRIIYALVGLAGIWLLIQLCIRGLKLFGKYTEKRENTSK